MATNNGVFFAALLAAVALVHSQKMNQKVDVTVYYESLCPDSMKFFTSQLHPAFNSHLGPYMNLSLVPFGKASFVKNETTGMYNFTCHHQELECYGNKVQACALADLQTQDKQVNFINCLMMNAKKEMEYPLNMCAEKNNFEASMIANCSNTPRGDELLAAMGNKTFEFQNPLTSVPTIVFNNKLNSSLSTMAFKDFKMTLCSVIAGNKPAECMAPPNSADSIAGSILLAVTSLFIAHQRL